jgi:hypothetical protein
MQAAGPGSELYTKWLWHMSSDAAFYRTVELPQFFTVVHYYKALLLAVFPAH